MRFLSKIRERQFAKKWGSTYNLSRAVLAGVLAAGCLMPGFAEAAVLVPSSGVNYTQDGNIATINNVNGNNVGTEYIFWWPGDGDTVKDCTINVNSVTIGPKIDIYGGQIRARNNVYVTGNTVTIKDTTFEESSYIYGGYSELGTANGNSVSISDSTINGDVRVWGGYSESGNANGNSVIINGGTFNGSVQGGNGLNAYGNSVIISDGQFNATVSGGDGGNAAEGNSVSISRGTINGVVSGGYVKYDFDTADKTANGNQVIISGGEFIDSLVVGGYVEYDGPETNSNTANTTANGNQVIISGGRFIDSHVAGGVAESGSDTANNTANNNKVILVGNNANYIFTDTQGAEQTLTGGNIEITGTVYGGWTNSDSGDASGNEIHVYGSNTQVKGLANFDNLNFYINEKITSDDVMLKITGEGVTDISKSKVEVTFDGAPPAKDDLKTITLIQKTDAGEESIIKAPSKNNIKVNCGPALTGSVDLENYGKDLVLTLKNFTVNENGKSLVETRAAAAFVVNNMSDFMLGQGMEQAKAAAGGVTPIDAGTMAPFAAVGGSNMRYTTGSYVDVNGWNGAVGFAKQADKLLFGVAVEHGRGNYDSYLDNGVHASGDIKSTGGVIFGEYKLDNGVHYDAALRAGRVKSDYSSTATSYDESSTYYGFSLGGGKELTVSDKATLDVYGRYYFSHTNGSDVSIATNQEIDFDAVNSHRLRIGGRYTTTLTEKSKAYAGLAWQYEFGGDAKAAINGYSAPTPSLQGHSAIVEAGYKLNAGKNLTLDFNLNGAMGKQRGIGGGIGAQWLF